MSHAPDDLLAVQRYVHERTGQDWAALGIVGDAAHAAGGGYHVGQDLLAAIGAAPGPQYPQSDYSYEDDPARDLAPPHDMSSHTATLAGDKDAASAFDMGGGFDRFLEFNRWMRDRMLAGDPRTRDIREMIHTLDGQTVHRIDRTGIQPDWGDDSHLFHTHFSFFRDSAGRRDRADNFLGLLVEFFDGAAPAPASREGDCDMVSGEVSTGAARTMIGLDDVASGLAKNGPAWLSFVTDPALLEEKGVTEVKLRVACTDGRGWGVPTITLGTGATKPDGSRYAGWRQSLQLATGTNGVRIDRILTSADDPAGEVEIGWCVMYGPKTV